MSDDNNTGNEPQKHEPTLAEVQALAETASKTAMEAKTAAEAKQTVAADVKADAEKQGIDLSDADAKKIADALVTQLDAMGVFADASAGSGNEPVPPTPAPAADGASAQPASATPPPADGPPAPVSTDSSPKKRTFAERFMGK